MRYMLLLLLLPLIFACEKVEQTKQPDPGEQSLESTVDSYWKAWMAKDWEKVINMTAPESREMIEPQIRSLSENPMAIYLDYKRIKVKVDGDTAIVEVLLTIDYLHPILAELSPQETTIFDYWVKRDQAWYRILERHDMDGFMESLKQ